MSGSGYADAGHVLGYLVHHLLDQRPRIDSSRRPPRGQVPCGSVTGKGVAAAGHPDDRHVSKALVRGEHGPGDRLRQRLALADADMVGTLHASEAFPRWRPAIPCPVGVGSGLQREADASTGDFVSSGCGSPSRRGNGSRRCRQDRDSEREC